MAMMDELNTFCAVVRSGSMSRAAHDLHLSQPAVSQRLRSLETDYGMQLLRRTNRGVELTPAGEVLSRYARRLMGLQQSLQDEMEALRSEEPRHVVIGATTAAGGYALPCTVYMFQQKHPTARIQLVIGNRSETIQRLNDGVLDLALVEGPEATAAEEPEGWQSMVVSEEDLVLITPTAGPLAQQEVYTLEELLKTPLILRESGSGTRQVVEKEFLEHGVHNVDLNAPFELNNPEAVKTSVAAGHGVSLVSKWCVRVEARIGSVRIVPLEGVRFVSRWTLFYPRANQRTMLNRALLRTLRSPAERGFC